MRTRLFPGLLLVLIPLMAGCINPFAPGEVEGDPVADLLGDPSTIEGFYTRFQKAYELRDTSLYGPLIHSDFTFTFRDFEINEDRTWDRPEEMRRTHSMFMNTHDITLQWNNILRETIFDDRTRVRIERVFNLRLVDSGSQTFRANGIASFELTRSDSTENWRLIRWRDESDI
ncbi:hypothetical protein QA596_07665 [Balneolales bacterium ANBcel1]|nr:hypothetical protein [Balneolales bacterium ANBcel1]